MPFGTVTYFLFLAAPCSTGEPKHVAVRIDTQDGSSTRTFDLEYDGLGFMTKARTQDTLPSQDRPPSPDLDREFNYEAVVTGGLDAGIVTRIGPDGMLTTYTYDEAYRLERVERRIPSDDILMDIRDSQLFLVPFGDLFHRRAETRIKRFRCPFPGKRGSRQEACERGRLKNE